MAQNTDLEKITAKFKAGSNCAQITATYFAEKYGEDVEKVHQLMCSFGGGMRQGEVCGAVTGGMLAMGMKGGNATPADGERKAKCYADTIAFGNEFKKRNGSLICRELLGCDISTPEGKKEFDERDLHFTFCPKKVLASIELLEEMGY